MSEAFILRELTGSRREVRLIGRALPYRPVEFGGSQAVVTNWYPGSRKATIHVLGPRPNEVPINGFWKTAYVGNAAKLTGFDEFQAPYTAEDLVAIFHDLRRSANEIELRWGQEVRRGIISSFIPRYHRAEDVEWEMRFEPGEEGPASRTRSQIKTQPRNEVRDDMNVLDDVAAVEPSTVTSDALDTVRGLVSSARAGVGTFTAAIDEVNDAANVAASRVNQVETAAAKVIRAARGLQRGTLDLPYTELLPVDDTIEVFKVENWRRDVGAQSRSLRASSVRSTSAIRARAEPGYLAVVTIRSGQTLRSLAWEYYGDSDAWTRIADANRLVGSIHAPGTVVRVPRAPATGDGVAT